jgi:hypothetical protein
MARYAKGKKSYAISDRGGQRVRYTQLKTTWDGLRVAPDEWEPKHPQLTPARNIIDAEQLFKPRSTGQDREDVVIYLAHTFDPFTRSLERKSVGAAGLGTVGEINSDDISLLILETGTAGTGAVGTETIQMESNPSASGLGGTGAVGTEAVELSIAEAGVAGTGAVGTEAVELSIAEAGVAGTGATGVELGFLEVTGNSGNGGTGGVGVEALNLSITEAGVAGTGAVGNETIDIPAWGFGTWGSGTWGN